VDPDGLAVITRMTDIVTPCWAVAAPRFSSFIPVLLSECSDRSAPMMHLVTVSPDGA